MLNNMQQMQLKLLQKESVKNQQKQLVTNNHDKEIPKERYVSPEKKQEIIDELRLQQYTIEISKNSQNNSENDKEIPKKKIQISRTKTRNYC